MEYAQKLAELQALSENFIRMVNKNQTSVKFKVLLFLKIYGVCSPKILIRKIGIIKTNLAMTLRQLMHQGFVNVSINPTDARSREFCLTHEGEKEVDKVLGEIENIISISDRLKEFDDALKTIVSVLNRKI
ncbi:MAG: winged helix-turn-helix transcriptional regulator [Clostridia bacterium]|nr:winged helix-turn-helix transcriptional regulator [Clostridia bacterium]